MFQVGEMFVSMTAVDKGLDSHVDAAGSRARAAAGALREADAASGKAAGGMQGLFAKLSAVTFGFNNIITTAKGVGSVLGTVGGWVGTLIGLASDANETSSKFGTVFGSAAKSAEADLAKFGNEVGRSRAELKGMAAGVQDLFVPLGFSREKAAEMSVAMSKLAVDVGSFNNKADADVMEAFKSALVGSHETVKQFGVVINDVTLKQELLRLGFQGSVQDASEQMKTIARMNLIMAGTSDAHGDASKTAGGFANQMKALWAKLIDVGTTLGQVLIPAAEVFTGWLNGMLSGVLASVGGFESWSETIKGWAEVTVTWLNRVVAVFTDWKTFSNVAWLAVRTLGEGAVEVFKWLWTNAVEFMKFWATNVMMIVPKALMAVWRSHEGLWDILKTGWSLVWEFIAGNRNLPKLRAELAKTSAEFLKSFSGPQFSGLGEIPALKDWEKQFASIDARMQGSRAEVGATERAFKGLDLGGVAGAMEKKKKKEVKVELTSVSDLFTRNLKAAFDDKENSQIEILKKQAQIADRQLDEQKKGNDLMQQVVNKKTAVVGR